MLWYWLFLIAIVLVGAALHAAGLARIDTKRHWAMWVIVALVLLNAGWMAFDGARALVVGDYVTPQSSGRLGPWSQLVQAVGIDPRSNLMKAVFVFYGSGFLIVLGAFLVRVSWSWRAMMIAAALGLWYVPFGTAINATVMVLLSAAPLATGRQAVDGQSR